MNRNTSTFLKKNGVTVVILIATLILAGIAVFTAIRLYQLRKEPVALNQPASTPAAQENENQLTNSQCKLSFTIQLASVRPTATATSSASRSPINSPTAKPTATPTKPPIGGNPTPTQKTPSPTATAAVQTASSPTPIGLPNAGVTLPTLLGIVAGILLLSSAVLIAL